MSADEHVLRGTHTHYHMYWHNFTSYTITNIFHFRDQIVDSKLNSASYYTYMYACMFEIQKNRSYWLSHVTTEQACKSAVLLEKGIFKLVLH